MTIYALLHKILPVSFGAKLVAAVWVSLVVGAVAGLATGADNTQLAVVVTVGGAMAAGLLYLLLTPYRSLWRTLDMWGRTGRVLPLPEHSADDMALLLIRVNALMARAQRSVDTPWKEGDIDPLTGALNAAAARRILSDAGAGWFIGIELSGYPAVARAEGEEVGNKMLLHTVETCSDIVRRDDLIARTGEARFVVFLPGASREVAARIADRIEERLSPDESAAWPPAACYAISRHIGGGAVVQALEMLEDLMEQSLAHGPGTVFGREEPGRSVA